MPKRRKSRKVTFLLPDDVSTNEEDTCRCICSDNNIEAKRPWVLCRACCAWQHNDCMDRSVFADELEAVHLCEQCKPDEHIALLEACYRGERPWQKRMMDRVMLKEQYHWRIWTAVAGVEWFWHVY
jgi:hypothetical protein